MDTENDLARLKWLLIVGVLFLISGFFSWREFKYIVFGTTVDASLVQTYQTEERGRRGRVKQMLVVEYRFTDKDGSARKEKDTISASSPAPTGPLVSIQYLSKSPGSSRLTGHTQRIWMFVFFGCLAYLAYKILMLVREAKA